MGLKCTFWRFFLFQTLLSPLTAPKDGGREGDEFGFLCFKLIFRITPLQIELRNRNLAYRFSKGPTFAFKGGGAINLLASFSSHN